MNIKILILLGLTISTLYSYYIIETYQNELYNEYYTESKKESTVKIIGSGDLFGYLGGSRKLHVYNFSIIVDFPRSRANIIPTKAHIIPHGEQITTFYPPKIKEISGKHSKVLIYAYQTF